MNAAAGQEFYVATNGHDRWSGRLAAPNADESDGPFATIAGARDALRNLKEAGRLVGPLTVWVRGGRYVMAEPVTFTPQDSWPTTYAAFPGETPILDGGTRIAGWQVERRGPLTLWATDVPDVADGRWNFRQLFVNGRRCPRTRVPAEGVYRIAEVPGGADARDSGGTGGGNRFRCAHGDIQAWENMADIDVLVRHWWVEERLPIVSFDAATDTVVCSRMGIFPLTATASPQHGLAEYCLENVKEALSEPGQWYLDRPAGRLWYVPRPGEDPDTAEAYAPRTDAFIRLIGDGESGRHVEHLRFVGLAIRHGTWSQPPGGGERWPDEWRAGDYGCAPQAAANVPGAIVLHAARHCALEDCDIRHIGVHAVELSHGCRGNRIVGNTMADLGGGGVKLESVGIVQTACAEPQRSGCNTISDNEIAHGGRVFANAIGVLCLDAFGNDICHNHIHDFYYSGISCGWVWAYGDHTAKHNRIERNHIHNIGQGVLSDLGGIYTLGVQPGTVIRGNLIHDITCTHYGGWGIYLDEGSSHIIVEDNIVYNVTSQSFFIHYGRENIVRNNIFAFGADGQAMMGRREEHVAYTFERNIVISDGQLSMLTSHNWDWKQRHSVVSDLNLFWDVSGKPLRFADPPAREPRAEYSLEQWRDHGMDRHSIVGDPRCRDLAGFDFALADDSPALALGFRPIDLSDVGPRPANQRSPAGA